MASFATLAVAATLVSSAPALNRLAAFGDARQVATTTPSREAATSSLENRPQRAQLKGQLHHRHHSYRAYHPPRKLKGSLAKRLAHQNRVRKLIESLSKRSPDAPLVGCRKFRRRQLALALRNGTFVSGKKTWLPLHFWHAKRMHCKPLYGSRAQGDKKNRELASVPMTSQRRGVKGLLREWRKSERAFAHDSSYLTPVFVEPVSREIAIRLLSLVLEPAHALHEQIAITTSSHRFTATELPGMLYQPGQFPHSPFGRAQVSFREMPRRGGGNLLPTMTKGARDFSLCIWITFPLVDSMKRLLKQALETVGGDPHLQIVSPRVNPYARFEISGQSASMKLYEALVPLLAPFVGTSPAQQQTQTRHHDLLSTLLESKELRHNCWKDGRVLSAHLKDPRLAMGDPLGAPNHDVKKENGKKVRCTWPGTADDSCIWRLEDLCPVLAHRATDKRIHDDRSSAATTEWDRVTASLRSAIDGSPTPLPETSSTTEAVVPILLIYHSGARASGSILERSSLPGYSLIVPVAWAHAVWQRLMQKRLIPIGLNERDELLRVTDRLSFPFDFPDTTFGWQAWTDLTAEGKAKDAKRPPSKRHETDYMSILQRVFGEDGVGSFSVIRNTDFSGPFHLPAPSSHKVENWIQTALERDAPHWQLTHLPFPREDIPALPTLPTRTFLYFLLKPTSRGVPQRGAELFLPSVNDLKAFIRSELQYKKFLLEGHASLIKKRSQKAFLSATRKQLSANFSMDSDEEDVDDEVIAKSHKWKGKSLLQSSNPEINRQLLGLVTSGMEPHVDRQGSGICLVDGAMFHDHGRRVFEFAGHPISHRLVLFRNPSSHWLRPALVEFLGETATH